jgi:hypothetical protein
MGYRSEVAYLIAFPNEAQLHAFVAQAKVLSNTPNENLKPLGRYGNMASALDECQIKPDADPPHISFYADSVKWYESYDDVQSHESLLALAKENYADGGEKTTRYCNANGLSGTCTLISAEFMRLGEDDNDTEHYSFGMSPLTESFYVDRRIGMLGSLAQNVIDHLK